MITWIVPADWLGWFLTTVTESGLGIKTLCSVVCCPAQHFCTNIFLMQPMHQTCANQSFEQRMQCNSKPKWPLEPYCVDNNTTNFGPSLWPHTCFLMSVWAGYLKLMAVSAVRAVRVPAIAFPPGRPSWLPLQHIMSYLGPPDQSKPITCMYSHKLGLNTQRQGLVHLILPRSAQDPTTMHYQLISGSVVRAVRISAMQAQPSGSRSLPLCHIVICRTDITHCSLRLHSNHWSLHTILGQPKSFDLSSHRGTNIRSAPSPHL